MFAWFRRWRYKIAVMQLEALIVKAEQDAITFELSSSFKDSIAAARQRLEEYKKEL